MTNHLSVRLCWHDSGWNGKVCRNPKQNKFCTNLDHIREKKDIEFENFEHTKKGMKLSSIDIGFPCERDIGVFGKNGYEIKFVHPLKKKKYPPYTGLGDCVAQVSTCSFYPAPYRWLMASNYDEIRHREGLNLRNLTKDEKERTWIYDVFLQEKLLKAFWNKLEAKKSFVIFYSNSTPAAEDTRRVIVGIGRIKGMSKMLLYGPSTEMPGPNYEWSREITHCYPEEGFRLPLQEYIDQGLNPENIMLTAPEGFENQFKYVSEIVSDGVMLIIAERLSKIIDLIQKDIDDNKIKLSEDWSKHKRWIQKVISELWKNRGRYPGIGSVLQFLGFNRGYSYHKEILSPLEIKNEDIFQHTLDILNEKKTPEKEYCNDFLNARNKWKAYSSDPDKKKLLFLLMRLEVSEDQVRRLVNETERLESRIKYTDNQILNNPYLISESDKGLVDTRGNLVSERIQLDTIDHAMVPSFYFPDRYPSDDDRRIRAIMIEQLSKAAEEGDTLLDLRDLVVRVRDRFSGDSEGSEYRECRPDLYLIYQNITFYEEMLTFLGDENTKFVALNEMRNHEIKISKLLRDLVKDKYEDEAPDWHKIMEEDTHFGKMDCSYPEYELEEKARAEKHKVLNKLYSNRFSVLTGRAGTGKTEALSIFIEGLAEAEGLNSRDILILAPTGKARVRIMRHLSQNANLKRIGLSAQTIHQHLTWNGWIDKNYDLKQSGGDKSSAKIIIVDEASMIPVDLFATLIKSIEFSNVERFILIGDPNQLPPIGPGRPFDDIVNWLRGNDRYQNNVADLRVRVRQRKSFDSVCLSLADGFLRDFKAKNIEEIYSRIERGELDENEDLYFESWDDPDELMIKLDGVLEKIGVSDHSSYISSIGLSGEGDVTECESWQILSPIKHKEVSGTIALNNYVQNKFLSNTLKEWKSGNWKYPRPFGKTKDIVHEDKVIQNVNTSKIWCYPRKDDSYVANGEIGVVRYYDKNRNQLKVEFADQIGYRYHYYNGESESSVEVNLDLAYAITIHKSQGSDFDKVILIIPKKAFNISMEMMYTALTRFKEKTYLLIQGGIETLQEYRRASRSETDRRNTFLFKIAVRDVDDEVPYAENRIHKTKNGFLVRSKSEVIVANELINAGIPLTEENYEKKLLSKDNPYDYKLPDFTFTYNGFEYYWEHLGMLSREDYNKSWQKKRKWYEENGYSPRLITSQDESNQSIDSQKIDLIIEDKLGIKIQSPKEFSLEDLKEGPNVEFKSSIQWDYENNKKDKKNLPFVIAKTISAFMNSSGGLLAVGITDDKKVLGIGNDLQTLREDKQNEDGLLLRVVEIISQYIGKEYVQMVSVEFKEIKDKKIILINVKRSDEEPTFAEENGDSLFFIRAGNSTQQLKGKEQHSYIRKNWD